MPMKTYEAIDMISKKVIAEGLCDAIILKGSIGRGDDDEFSDVDMYLITKDENREKVMQQRETYLKAYQDIMFLRETNFGLPQFIAIYENGLHVDLYVASMDQLQHSDPIKVYYDPDGIFNEYTWQRDEFSMDEIARCFEDTLYYFTEANSAYERKNYPWTIRIMDSSISNVAILLRYSYDKIFTFLGLKKINEIIPHEQYILLENAFVYLGKLEFQKASDCIMKAMDVFIETCSKEMKEKLNMKLYQWVKINLNQSLFVER